MVVKSSDDEDSSSLIATAFTFIAAAIFFGVLIGLIILFDRFVLTKCKCGLCIKLFDFIKKKVMFNSVLRAFLQMYLLTCISIATSFTQVSFGNSLGATDFVTTLLLFAVCLVVPIVIHRLLTKNQEKLPSPQFKGKYESIYQNVDYHKPVALNNTAIFLLRRILFAFFVVVILDFSIVFQILLADILSTLLLCFYFSYYPMRDRLNNFVQTFNELIVLLSIQLMFIFTPYVDDAARRYDLAWNWLYLVAVDIVINIAIMFYIIGRKIYVAIRSSLAKRRAKRLI